MATLILDLDDPAALDAAAVGGKAAALARMRRAGLPVPDGFAVSVHAFLEATAAALPSIAKRPARTPVTRVEPSRELRDAVGAAYAALGEAVPVAVRSSATAEDLAGASFAGQYESYLNVVGLDALVERLAAVWASLNAPHAVAYRARHGIAEDAARMAVLVQRQLKAEAAGVLFTRDPLSGARDRFVVSAALGLGEGVVAGDLAADGFVLDADSFAPVERSVAVKDRMVVLAAAGGVEDRPVPPARRREPALSDGQLADLGRLARAVRDLFGEDRDIEFALAGGALHLLQARPITGVGGDGDGESERAVRWDEPADARYTWALGGSKPQRRFEEDAQDAWLAGARRCFAETGSSQARNHLVRRVHGFAFFRSPSVSEAEISERQRRHRERDGEYRAAGASLYESEIRPPAEAALRRLNRFHRLRRAGAPELLAHLEDALEAYGYVMGDLHWRMTGAMQLDWPSRYSEITGEPEVESGVLLQAIDNRTTQLVRRLCGLARLVQEDAPLRSAFRDRDYDRLESAPLRERLATRRFRSRLRRLLRDFGTRSGRGFGSSSGFADPTWNMDPRAPLDLVASYAEQDLDELARRESEARTERRRAERRVRRALRGDAEKLARFDASLPLAVEQVRRMEDHNYLMEQGVAGALREAVHLLGAALAREGLLDAADDALDLSLDEMRAAGGEDGGAGQGGAGLRALVRERRAEFEQRSRLRPPRTIGRVDRERRAAADGEAPGGDADGSDTSGSDTDGSVLRGVAASRGRGEGRARVFVAGEARPELERGDILVARNAGPDWTLLLPLLGGIVLDEGAVFQHAALVAREYRVPAVIQTRTATRAIRDGQLVAVDGDAGTVDLAPRG